MKILKLFGDYPFIPSYLDNEREITDIVYDSRKAAAGKLFVAMRGVKSDGHDFCAAAYDAGCRDFVVERKVSLPDDAITYLVSDTRRALSVLSKNFFAIPFAGIRLIAVTGTKGKTSTCLMIKSILEKSGKKVGYIGTLGVMYDGREQRTENSTPESYELFRFLREMYDCGCEFAVMEASSQGVKMKRTADLFFDLCVFTNLSPDHIGPGEHESFEEYLACKKELFGQCALSAGNRDDKYYTSVVTNRHGALTLGLSEGSDIKAENISFETDGGRFRTRFECVEGGRRFEVMLPLPGMFSVYNALAAICSARAFSIPYAQITDGLADVHIKGRTEIVPGTGDISVIIDYAHNELSVKSLFDMLRLYNPRRLIAVFGCGGNRSKLRRYAMGEIISQNADLSVITSDNPRYENPDDIIADIMQGVGDNKAKTITIKDRREAIEYALSKASAGDIVAIVGKGDQDYEEINGIKHPFSEPQIVADYFRKASR